MATSLSNETSTASLVEFSSDYLHSGTPNPSTQNCSSNKGNNSSTRIDNQANSSIAKESANPASSSN